MTVIVDGTNGITFPNTSLQASAGVILQVVSTINNASYSTASSSYQPANAIAVTITPKFSTSKIYIVVTGGNLDNGTAGNECTTTVYRGATDLGISTNGLADYYATSSRVIFPIVMSVLDSPATTSATTYTMYYKTRSSVTVTINNSGTPITITAIEVAA